MIRSTHLLLTVTDDRGEVAANGCSVAGFPAQIRLKIEMSMEDGSQEATWVTIPLKITDAMGIPPVKRLFLPPSSEEMLEAQTKLGDLERRLEEDD